MSVVNQVGLQTIKVSELKRIAYLDKIKEYQKEAFIDSINRKNIIHDKEYEIKMNKKIKDKIDFYRESVDTFEKIHSKYISRYDILNEETPITAFFILFARVISLLKMTLLCIEKNYLSAFILIRPIDEAVTLAEYFIFSVNTEEGQRHLKQWYREDISPSNRICRDFMKKHSMNTFSDKRKDLFDNDLTRQMYYLKSKPIHSTLNSIMSEYTAEIKNEEIIPLGFEYGESKDLVNIWGLVSFFQSSIWTSIQGFLTCALGRVDLTEDVIFKGTQAREP